MAKMTRSQLAQLLKKNKNVKKNTNSTGKEQLNLIVPDNQIPELHKLKTITVGDGDSDQGVKLPGVGSIRKLIITVDTSGASFTGGTSPAFSRVDFILKNFKINFNDEFFGAREPISGTLALQALRQVRRTQRAISSQEGEYVIEFPVSGRRNAMLPAGKSIEFSFDYTINDVASVTSGSPTAFSGVVITISAERYATVYPPTLGLVYKSKSVTVSALGDLEVDYNDKHAFKLLGFISFDNSDALADILSSVYWNNNGRRVTYLEPAIFRNFANDKFGSTPSSGIIFHEPETPLVSKELKATIVITDATDVELYYFTVEVV